MVLGELATVLGLPEGSGPSLQQWERLVVSCAGTLAATNFACIAEHFMGLRGGHHTFKAVVRTRGMSNISDVAQAMGAVAAISIGSLASITLVGGAACGWVAAFAHWFLSFDVEIRRSDRGKEILYSSSLDGQAAISVVYDVRGSNDDLMVRRTNRTYIVRDLEEDLFLRVRDRSVHCFSGRVPWENALAAAFGPQARILLQRQELGLMLGAAARIFLAIYETDQDVSRLDRRKTWPGYGGGSFALGYLQSAVRWLPELQGVFDVAEASSGGSMLQAYAAFQNAANALCEVCACIQCQKARDNTSIDDDPVNICLRLLGDMIVALVWDLSSMHLETPLQRSLRGLQHMYTLWCTKNGRVSEGDRGAAETLFDDRKNLTKRLSLATVCSTAAIVFGGNVAQPWEIVRDFGDCRASAFTSGGICFYFGMLKNISDRPDAVTVLHVLPGCIQLKSGQTVTQVEDIRFHRECGRLCPTYLAGNRQPYDASKVAEDTGSNLSVELLVQETAAKAVVYFRLSSIRGICCDIGVTSLLRAVLASAGLVPCNAARHQDPFTLPADGITTRDGEEHVNVVTILMTGDPLLSLDFHATPWPGVSLLRIGVRCHINISIRRSCGPMNAYHVA